MTDQAAKTAPPIRFRQFDNAWTERRLGDVSTIGDADHWMPATTADGIPYVMTGDFSGVNEIDFDKAKRISQKDYEQLSKKIKPEYGDILFARYASIGSVRLIKTTEKFIASYSCAIIKGNRKFNSDYLYSLLQSGAIKKQVEQLINTGSQGNVGIESLKNLTCSFPGDREQEKVGEFFQELDRLIWLHQRKSEKLIALKKAMLQKMFPEPGLSFPEVRFAKFSSPWESIPLDKLGHPYSGLFGKTKEDFGWGDARFVTYMGVFSNAICGPDATAAIGVDRSQNEVKRGDVMFTISSETPEEVGMSSVWSGDDANVYLNSFCFGFRPLASLRSEFLAYVLRASAFRSRVRVLAQGISRYNISKAKVMNIPISVPTEEEQERIGMYFCALDALIAKHATQVQKLRQFKSACLEAMFV